MRFLLRIDRLLLLLSGCLWYSCNVTDDTSPLPSEVFVKYYGVTAGSQVAVDLIYNEDQKEYLILGQRTNTAALGDFYFAVADEAGNLLRETVWDMPGEDVPKRIKQISETEYLFIGTNAAGGYLQTVWGTINHNTLDSGVVHRIYSTDVDGVPAGTLDGADIQLIDSDSVVIFSTASIKEDGDFVTGNGTQFHIAKASLTTGETGWRKTYGDIGNEIALSFFVKDNGGLTLFGSTESPDDAGNGGTNVYVLGTTSIGNPDAAQGVHGLAWTTGVLNDVPFSVLNLQNSFVVVGTSTPANSTNSFPFLLFLDQTGQAISSAFRSDRLVNGYLNGLPSEGHAVARTISGDLVVLGSYNAFQTSGEASTQRLEEVMVLKTNALGERMPEYDEYYGFSSGDDEAVAAITLPDGKIAVLCTFDFGSGTTLIGLMKLNEDGKLKP